MEKTDWGTPTEQIIKLVPPNINSEADSMDLIELWKKKTKRIVGQNTARKMKFSIKDFFSKCDLVCRFLGNIYWKKP